MNNEELKRAHNWKFEANTAFGKVDIDYAVDKNEKIIGWAYCIEFEAVYFCNPLTCNKQWFPMTQQPSIEHLRETLHAIADHAQVVK